MMQYLMCIRTWGSFFDKIYILQCLDNNVDIKKALIKTYKDFLSDVDKPRKRMYWSYALFSLIPGVGQWLKGEHTKGQTLLILGVIFFAFGWVLALMKAIYAVITVYSVVDALLHEPDAASEFINQND